VHNHDFAAIDEQKFKPFHWLATLTTGLGVFCDGYDLSSIALVLPLVLATFGQKSLTGFESAALAASALVGATIGALVFGVLGQKGRMRFYGYDVLVLAFAAIAQAFAPNLDWLIGIRFVLGFGVGADYVLSPMIMAEHSNRADRGRALGLGFGTMWPVGALAAALFNLLLYALHTPADWQWRLVLAAGAIPAFSVVYLRRQMPETARFLARLGGDGEEAARVIGQISGESVAPPARDHRTFKEVFALHAREIVSGAILWMIYDLVVYAVILFGPSLIAKSVGLGPVTFSLLIQLIFVLPPSILFSLFLIDRVGRKPLQVWGFLIGAVLLAIFALLQHRLLEIPITAFIVFGLFNVAETGPGLVSGAGILGVELAPTRIRSVAQSITVAGGRFGAALSAFAFPLLFAGIGQAGAYWCIVGASVLGAVLTQVLVPETSRRSLEEIAGDAHSSDEARPARSPQV